MRKFVDTLPLLDKANNLGQFLPVAVPDATTYPGSDYYVIKLVEFEQQMHSDLPPTRLRGYVQMVGNGTPPGDPGYMASLTPATSPQYLGPVIVAQKDRPVRVLFINGLSTGAGGDLFVPVDQTIMGAGDYHVDYNPVTKELMGAITGRFTQNRGELHLHGGRTPWISDGTPHQWITPAGDADASPYPQGVSVTNVPDMPDPGPGAQTYYWTNQQSARLMFYHDHAWGLTRLNVYVGEAAGYLVQDPTETALVNEGLLPADQIPLIIQDKTFVDGDPASPTYVLKTDPTWRWGTGTESGAITEFGKVVPVRSPKTGDLWWPHVYMPAQNPFDITGIAPMGRWAYGPYFWPANNNPYQPVPNPYFNSQCDAYNDADGNGVFDQRDIDLNKANILGYTAIPIPGAVPDPVSFTPVETPFCQPPEIPSTPNPSWGAEAFMDTPVVNGTAYPVLEVEPKAYRLRILNAAHDRFFNLSIFKADTVTLAPVDHCTGVGPTVPCDQRTEVAMVDATGTLPGWPATWPADGRPGGVPDWTKAGPAWLQIGTEGGFLPRPVTIPPQPVTWNNDVTTFNAGNVNGGSLILGPAERADVVVDFTAYAGQTLILYNAAPAPWPALDPHYDYFTGAPDMTEAGGAAPTLPGLGPNTRTVMKIVVKGVATVPSTFSASELDKAFTGTRAAGTFSAGATAFGQGQDPLIVGQGNLNPTADPAHYEAFLFDQDYSAISSIYGSFPTVWPDWGVARINDKALHFIGTNGDTTYTFNAADTATHPLDNSVKLYGGIPMMFKAIQDEQGETFDDYGRMRAGLGLEMLNAGAGQVNFIIQTYSDPSTEILEENGIQVWKITHNGVDTHPIHFHLYDVQVINRVGWDGFIRLPDPNELGWKDTLRVSPLEDTIVALRPVTPRLPFGVPESKRPLNPARPIGDPTELTQIDPFTGNARNNLNRFENLDWEYVWHCHILSHEENDMMRNQSFLFQETVPDAPEPLNLAGGTTAQVDLAWTDPTPVNFATLAGFGDPKGEIGFRVERSPAGANTFTPLATVLANATTYSDTTVASGTSYDYRVVAYNAAGDSLPSSTVTVAAQTYYTVAVSAGAGGSVTPAGPSVVVPANGSQTFDIAPATGYHIVGITVDGTPMGALTSHTFSNVTANHTLAAEFAINTYTITATAGANGSIDPVGATTVNYGGSQAYTITPATGYHVVDVTVDGVSVGALTGYTFSNVTADRTIAATFAINTYTLTATAGTGGTITPADATTVNYGGSQAYTIAPAAGYLISDVLVDGVSQGVITSYTFSNVTADHAIAATFIPIAVAPATLTVPATVTANHDVPVTADASPTPGAVYSFEYSGNNGATWTAGPSGTAASVTITVPANGSYLFRVSVTATGYARSAYTQSSACTVNANAQPAAALTVPAISNDGSIPLSWTASATPGVTYLLYESKNGGAYSQVASTTATAATLTGRTNGTYTYQVKAVATGWGDSTLANGSNACVVTLIAQPVPALTVPATSTDGTIAISWTSSPTPGVTYQLYQSKNGGAYALVATTTATSVTLTGRTNGSHVFRIKATLAGWADSSWTTGSNACVVTLTVQPVASLTVPAASNDGTIFLQWAASATPGVTYQVQQSRNGGPYALVASITGTSVALNGRTDGTYTYRVRAIKSGWVSTSWTDGSNPCVVTRVVQPVALLNVPATSAGSIALTWTASPTSGVTYQLYESRNGGAYTQLTGTTATSRTLTGRTAGSYTYQIRAVKAGWAPSTMTDGSNPCVVGVP